ncbi:MAG: hypothetical protein II500_01065, partial [Campylobacter sp.]|nr:hypothetical protein [Campylobacter sp.]
MIYSATLRFARNLPRTLCVAPLRLFYRNLRLSRTASLVFTELRLSLRDFALAKIVAITKA